MTLPTAGAAAARFLQGRRASHHDELPDLRIVALAIARAQATGSGKGIAARTVRRGF